MKFASIAFPLTLIAINRSFEYETRRCLRFHLQALRGVSIHLWMGSLCGESIVSELEVQVFHYHIYVIYENRIEKFWIMMSPPRCYNLLIIIIRPKLMLVSFLFLILLNRVLRSFTRVTTNVGWCHWSACILSASHVVAVFPCQRPPNHLAATVHVRVNVWYHVGTSEIGTSGS